MCSHSDRSNSTDYSCSSLSRERMPRRIIDWTEIQMNRIDGTNSYMPTPIDAYAAEEEQRASEIRSERGYRY